MNRGLRAALIAGGATLGPLLVVYGLSSFASWRRAELSRSPTQTPSETSAPLITLEASPSSPPPFLLGTAEARTDTDEDGLPDALESVYGTNPHDKDTDGDGFLDGSEVANGYDPTKKSPGDRIVIPTPSPTGPTFTQQYFDRVGLSPSRENLVKSGELDEFIATVNARGFLPEVRDDELRVTGAAGKEVVVAYLDAISIPQNKALTAIRAEDLGAAFRQLTENKDSKPLDDIAASLAKNAVVLRAVVVPSEALALHKQYVAATLALKENAEALRNYQGDFVGVLVSASRIDNLRGVFRTVSEGIVALERKYDIT